MEYQLVGALDSYGNNSKEKKRTLPVLRNHLKKRCIFK
jgi:hypothetical protein